MFRGDRQRGFQSDVMRQCEMPRLAYPVAGQCSQPPTSSIFFPTCFRLLRLQPHPANKKQMSATGCSRKASFIVKSITRFLHCLVSLYNGCVLCCKYGKPHPLLKLGGDGLEGWRVASTNDVFQYLLIWCLSSTPSKQAPSVTKVV